MEEGISQPSSYRLNNRKSGIRIMEKLFTKQQVADHLQVSTRTVDRLIGDMDLPVYHIRRQIRIPQSSVKMILNESMSGDERDKIINGILEV
jgi:excisionase family DNA binding protein|tara:strand:- start:147 stop:422 length:276 start_codon:yes stop_codon:yes gene_type:complete